MRKIALPLLVAVAMGASSAAMAVTNETTTGIIKSLDAKACTVTLADKNVFHLHFKKTCDLSKLKVGENVKVTWHAVGTVDWATRIAKV